MDQPFVSTMANAYCSDNDLPIVRNEEFQNYFNEVMLNLKKDNYDLYDLLHEFNRGKQQSLIYSFLDNYREEKGEIEENQDELLQEELTAGVMMLGAIMVWLGTMMWRASPSSFFQTILNWYKDSPWAMPFRDVSNLFGLSTLFKVAFDKYGESYSDRYKVAKIVLQDNYNNCMQHCGISEPSKMAKIALFRSREKSKSDYKKIPKYMTNEAQEQADCLLPCYLDYATSAFAELSIAYRNCLEKTGESSNMQMGVGGGYNILMKYPVGEVCLPFHDELTKLYDQFNLVLKTVFEKDRRAIQNWLSLLDEKISKAHSGQHLKPMARDMDGKPRYVQMT